jgi:hypothetical protein
MAVQIQSVVMRDLKSCSSQRAAPVAELGKLAIDPAIAEASTRLVEKVFDSCSQVTHQRPSYFKFGRVYSCTRLKFDLFSFNFMSSTFLPLALYYFIPLNYFLQYYEFKQIAGYQ